jgi:hypothetical protein
MSKSALDLSGTSAQTNTSGTSVVSGTSWTFSGPFYVTTQTLEVDYLRVPDNLNIDTKSITLSGATATYLPVPRTKIVAIVNATVQASLDFAGYSTSAYQQPQRFQINSTTVDPNGVSYGLSSHFNASTMGPMGTVNTTQPFYSRVPYDDPSNQPVFSKTVEAATFTMYTQVSGSSNEDALDITNYWTDYDLWKDAGATLGGNATTIVPGTFRTSTYPAIKLLGSLYAIWGNYVPDKEFIQGQTSLLDMLGTSLKSESLYKAPISNTVLRSSGAFTPENDTGIAEYDKSRHEY